MHIFKDMSGQAWTMEITIATLRRVRAATGVDLLDIEALAGKLATDIVLLVDILYVVVRSQADDRGINDEQFGARLDGASLEDASEVLLRAIVDFFPEPRRKLLQKVIAAGEKAVEAQMEKVEREVDRALLEQPGEPSISAPESAELTQDL